MKKILLSAFACDPTQGSELGNGWNWATGLAKLGYEVHCLTRKVSKENIDSFCKPDNLFFHFIELPVGLDNLYSFSQPTMYLHYVSWQWLAYKRGKKLHKQLNFDLAHHVTWGSVQMGSFLYKIDIPFIFGPAGGGQIAPANFKEYFLDHWDSEIKREKVSQILVKWNPAFKKMISKAKAVLVSNKDTYKLANREGGKNVHLLFDVGLPTSFFPETVPSKENAPSSPLKLLWVGRFLPRKGILLVLDIMAKLKHFPEITLTVVGDGEMKEAFLEKIKSLGLDKQVNWVGLVPFDQVRSFYASHDVFLFTSLRDSGGVQLVEAMAYGLPVVTLDIHGSSMIVEADRGIKVNVSNPEQTIQELTSAILSLNNDRKRLNTLSQGALSFAKQHTWEHILDVVTNQFYK